MIHVPPPNKDNRHEDESSARKQILVDVLSSFRLVTTLPLEDISFLIARLIQIEKYPIGIGPHSLAHNEWPLGPQFQPNTTTKPVSFGCRNGTGNS